MIPVGTNDMEQIVREVLSQMKATATMNLKLALALMEKVEAEAKRIGVKAVVAVSDASGRPVAIHCTDGAFIGSFDVALNKTYTAVAFQMSTAKLAELAEQQQKEKIEDIKGVQKEIAWGSQIRSYVFHPYNLVKDHRTGFEMGNIGAVMDGDLNGFINAYLKAASLGKLSQ